MKTIIALMLALLVCSAAAEAAPGNGNGNAGGNGQGNGNAGGNGQGNGAASDAGNGNADGDGQGNGNAGGNGQGNGAAAQDNGQGATTGGAQPAAQSDAQSQAPGQSQALGADQAQGDGHAQAGSNEAVRDAPAAPGQSGETHGNAPAHAASTVMAPASSEVSAASSSDGPDTPAVVDASSALQVERGAAGNRLSWEIPASSAGQVQVWRLDPAGWVPIALTTSAGQAFDANGQQNSEYRLTWSEEPLAANALASVASSLSFAPAVRDAGTGIGGLLLALLWAGAGAFATVRSHLAPRRVNEGRIADDNQLLPVLAGVPGVDLAAVDRVVALGLRTVGQLRRLDANALAFWTGLPAATVRTWQETIELMQWPALPPGAAQRLALAGHATLADVAAARPAELMASLHVGTSSVVGPGLPKDEQEVVNWVAEARQALGLSNRERLSTPPTAATPVAASTATA